MKKLNPLKKLLALTLVGLLFLLNLVACQSPQKEQASPSTQADKSQATEAPQAAEKSEPSKQPEASENAQVAKKPGDPLYGGRVVLGITQEPDFLDPHLAVAAGTKEILFNIFEGLVRLTPEGDLEPCLAQAWEVEEDGRLIRFQLREGVKFHNGANLTAEDVKYSLERAAGLEGEKILVPELQGLEKVEIAKDGQEVLVYQKTPDANLLAYLTCAIIPQGYTDQDKAPIGTGPFRFKAYQPQVSLDLVKFADYWEAGKPYLDEVSFKIYGDMDAAYLELMAGQIDIFPYLTAEKVLPLQEKYEIVTGGANMVQVMGLNNNRPPLDKLEVREAVNLALGRSFISQQIMGEYGRPIFSGMAPSMGRFFKEDLPGDLEAQPDLAKEKLAAAGFADGLDLELTVPGNYLIHVDTANLIAAQLAKANMRVEIETVDWGTWLERVYANRDYQMTVIALTYDYYTPSDVLNRYMTDSADNFINFSNEAYDELGQAASKETDLDQRVEDYQKMQEILWEDKAAAFLQEPFNITAVQKGLGGYVQYPAYVQDMARVYFVDQEALDKTLAD